MKYQYTDIESDIICACVCVLKILVKIGSMYWCNCLHQQLIQQQQINVVNLKVMKIVWH